MPSMVLLPLSVFRNNAGMNRSIRRLPTLAGAKKKKQYNSKREKPLATTQRLRP